MPARWGCTEPVVYHSLPMRPLSSSASKQPSHTPPVVAHHHPRGYRLRLATCPDYARRLATSASLSRTPPQPNQYFKQASLWQCAIHLGCQFPTVFPARLTPCSAPMATHAKWCPAGSLSLLNASLAALYLYAGGMRVRCSWLPAYANLVWGEGGSLTRVGRNTESGRY